MKLYFDLDSNYYTDRSIVRFKKAMRKAFLSLPSVNGKLTMDDMKQDYTIDAITPHSIQITYTRDNGQAVNINLQPYYHYLDFLNGEYKRL